MHQGLTLGLVAASNLFILALLQWLPLFSLGANKNTDLFFSALAIPMTIGSIIGSNIVQVSVPILIEKNSSLQQGIFEVVFFTFSILGLIIFVATITFTPIIIDIIFPFYTEGQKETVVLLTKTMMIGTLFSILCYAYSSKLYAKGTPLYIELAGVISGIITIALFLFNWKQLTLGFYAWIINIRWIFLFIILVFISTPVIPTLCRKEIKAVVKKTIGRLKNLVLGGAIYKSDVLVDRHFSAQAQSGDLTILYLVQQFYAAVSTLLNKALFTPNLKKLSEENSKSESIKRMFKIVTRINFIYFLLLATLFISSVLFFEFVFFGAPLKQWMHVALLTSGVIVASTFGAIFTVRYYSQGNTLTPTKVGLIGFSLSILLKLILFKKIGFDGLLVAISLYYIFNLTILYILYRRETSVL